MIFKVNGRDITAVVGGATLSSSVDTLGAQLDFDTAYHKPYLYTEIAPGDTITLEQDKEVFRGIVVTKTLNEYTQTFNCFDYAFYLNKSKVVKQFNKVRADVAIRQLLGEFGVPVGEVAAISHVVTRVFYNQEVSAVLQEILTSATQETGVRYVMEMDEGKLHIFPDTARDVRAIVRLASNIAPVNCMDTIGQPTRTESIEDMKNSAKVFVGDEKGVKVYAEAANQALVQKYGLLQETESIDSADISKARNIAQSILAQHGKVGQSASVTVLGSFDLRAGRVVTVDEPMTGLRGRYRILSAAHTIGQAHTTALDLEVIA